VRSVLGNLALLGLSTLVALLVLELVVFRFVVRAPDLPRPEFVEGVIKYAPNQRGVTRIANEAVAPFRINAQGWNSRHASYDPATPPGVERFVIIGDSYVNALTVPFDSSVAEQLEDLPGAPHQVYRFGISGAPLSQYLHVLRHEALRYDPRMVIVLIVHNDFSESYTHKRGVYASSFLKLEIHPDSTVTEVPPLRYETRWFDPIRNGSSIWRVLAYRYNVRFSLLRNLILGRSQPTPDRQTADPENSGGPSATPRFLGDSLAAAYVLTRMKELTDRSGAQLLLVMDGDRRELGSASETDMTYRRRLNALVAGVGRSLEVPVIDLDPVFRADYSTTGRLPHLQADHHWNAYGHSLAARTIHEFLTSPSAQP
jgi:hypothetical protein